MSRNEKTESIKVVFVGEANVGKTSIAYRMKEGHLRRHEPTIASGFVSLESKGGKKISIWDTSGSERFNALLPMYVRGSKIIISVFDVTDSNHTLNRILDYRQNFIENIVGTEKAHLILVGNKADKLHSWPEREKIEEQAQEFVNMHGLNSFILVSALDGDNIENLFQMISTVVDKSDQPDKDDDVIRLGAVALGEEEEDKFAGSTLKIGDITIQAKEYVKNKFSGTWCFS